MTYNDLVRFCGNERQAYFLAGKIPYREMSEQQVENAVLALLVHVAERAHRQKLPKNFRPISGQALLTPKLAKVLTYRLAPLHVSHDEKSAFVFNRSKQSQHGEEVVRLFRQFPVGVVTDR
jgi:hypothetical protein